MLFLIVCVYSYCLIFHTRNCFPFLSSKSCLNRKKFWISYNSCKILVILINQLRTLSSCFSDQKLFVFPFASFMSESQEIWEIIFFHHDSCYSKWSVKILVDLAIRQESFFPFSQKNLVWIMYLNWILSAASRKARIWPERSQEVRLVRCHNPITPGNDFITAHTAEHILCSFSSGRRSTEVFTFWIMCSNWGIWGIWCNGYRVLGIDFLNYVFKLRNLRHLV